VLTVLRPPPDQLQPEPQRDAMRAEAAGAARAETVRRGTAAAAMPAGRRPAAGRA